MTNPVVISVIGFANPPEVRLLDAVAANLDEPGMRAWARAECAASGAHYVVRSYRYPLAISAWHSEPVGVDIERVGPCSEAFAGSILAPSECAAAVTSDDPDTYITSLWCSKEALAKALGDAVRYDPRRLNSPIHWPDRQAGPWRAAQLEVAALHIAWLCWRVKETAATVSPPSSVAIDSVL